MKQRKKILKFKRKGEYELYSIWPITVHGILQARILEWVAVPFSAGSAQPRNQI